MTPLELPARRRLGPLWLVACLSASFVLFAPQVRAAEIGVSAPDIELTGASVGKKLSDFKGRVVYLDFWASWCGPCRKSFPWMNDMQTKYGAKGLQVLGVNVDAKRGDADEFLAQTPAKFAVAFDPKGEAAKRFQIKGMPTSVLIDAEGKVIAVHQGFRDEDRASLEARLAAALNRQ